MSTYQISYNLPIHSIYNLELESWRTKREKYRRFRLRNDVGVELEVTSLGASVTALRVPDAAGENPVDVVLGFDNAEDYLSAKNPYFGATVGRVANREVYNSMDDIKRCKFY